MNYQAFGLRLSSSLSLPLIETSSDAAPDGVILCGDVPLLSKFSSLKPVGLYVNADSENVLVDIAGIARYHCQFNKITIQALSSCEADIVTFLFYAALPYWLMLRGKVILRGCAITWDGVYSQLWVSHSGAGSSTLAAYALQQGAKLLSDHVCVVNFNEKQVEVQSGIPYIKLWQDALRQLNIESTSLNLIRPGLKQFLWDASESFSHQPLPVSQIISLSVANDVKDASLKRFSGLEKLKYINVHDYCNPLSGILQRKTLQAPLWVSLANQAVVYSFIRLSGQQINNDFRKMLEGVFPQSKESILA